MLASKRKDLQKKTFTEGTEKLQPSADSERLSRDSRVTRSAHRVLTTAHSKTQFAQSSGLSSLALVCLSFTERELQNLYDDLGAGFLEKALAAFGLRSDGEKKKRLLGMKSNKYDNNLAFIEAAKVYGVKKQLQDTRKVSNLLH